MVKSLPASAGDIRDAGSMPGLESSPGEGNGNILQCSRPENPMDRGTWRATVHGVSKSWTGVKRLHTHVHGHILLLLGYRDYLGRAEKHPHKEICLSLVT